MVNAAIIRHLVLVIVAAVGPFLVGRLQHRVVNPLLALAFRVFLLCMTYLWQIALYLVLSMLFTNIVSPVVADFVVSFFDHYALYDSWPVRTAMWAGRWLALDVFASWVQVKFAGMGNMLSKVFAAPIPLLEFLTTQLNMTVHKFA